ncbi:unnamed protein product [Adineta ricciae]|uniref:Uncharacterized protein n=1 Tax=Adineta ricciae TaxID=249248 RepID=A0A815QUT4_ADIRI|nr:unnamed protein product [Adineta ricciae]
MTTTTPSITAMGSTTINTTGSISISSTTTSTVLITTLTSSTTDVSSTSSTSTTTSASTISSTTTTTQTTTSIEPTLRFIFDGGPADCSYLDNISITDNNAPSVQLLSNPSFENSTSSPVGWSVANSSTCQGVTQGQVITSGCQTSSGNNCFKAYCVRGYEYLFQSFNATIGDFYTISFWLEQTGGPAACIYVDVI